MKEYSVFLKNTDRSKTAVVFTWDDNFERHLSLIAPEFEKRGMRCTFFINPGHPAFEAGHLPVCRKLLERGHEIGSHSSLHENFTELTKDECLEQITGAIGTIREKLGVYPSTFAFPYHAYDEEHLELVRQHHLETRNTLSGSKWIGIETAIPLQSLRCAVDGAVAGGYPLVFAGHSAVISPAEIEDVSIDTGYEPILLDNLTGLLDYIRMLSDRAEVLTLEQAALKAFVLDNARPEGDAYVLSAEQTERLAAVGMDGEKINRLL